MTDPKLKDVIEKMGSGLEQFTVDAGKKITGLEDRLGMLEARDDRPEMSNGDRQSEMKALGDFARTGRTESKTMTVGSDADGGAMVLMTVTAEKVKIPLMVATTFTQANKTPSMEGVAHSRVEIGCVV